MKPSDAESTFWVDVTEDFELDNGTIRHPVYSNRVLQKRDEQGEPDYILIDSFHKKVKRRVTEAGLIVRAKSEGVQ
jgi:hypothetical protein